MKNYEKDFVEVPGRDRHRLPFLPYDNREMRKRDPCRHHDELHRRRKNESRERAIPASREVPKKQKH